jgi:cell division protein FtsI/penicillin-binding protein 2
MENTVQTMHDAEPHTLRRVNLLSAFAHSSNVGISKLITEYYNKNPEKYLQAFARFRIGSET